MSIQHQEFICGLSQEVTIAVLPRLNMEELMFELNRRIQNLDKENSIKDRLVSILRDVMLEEYCQWKRRSQLSSPDETTIFGQNQDTAAIQEKFVLTLYAGTMVSETSSYDTSQQRFGLDIVIKKERDTSSEVLMHTEPKDLDSDSDLIIQPNHELCNTPSSGSQMLPSYKTSLTQMNVTADSLIKEEDIDMSYEDAACRARDDELDIDTSIFSMQVLNTINSMNTSYSETPVESDTPAEEAPLASCHLPPDNGDVPLENECYVLEDDQIKQTSQASNPDQTEHYTDDRETGFINSGLEQSREESNDESSEEKSFAHSVPKHRQRHKEEMPFMCGECGYRASSKHQLVRHMRKHTGEKPFKCNHCNFKASVKHNLVQHMKRHKDAEPYRCKICVYKTYRKSDVEKHKMYHSGVKSYKCEECEYRTTRNYHLTRHRRRHTGERYSCQECDYKSIDKSNFVRHMRKKHQ